MIEIIRSASCACKHKPLIISDMVSIIFFIFYIVLCVLFLQMYKKYAQNLYLKLPVIVSFEFSLPGIRYIREKMRIFVISK